MSISKTASSALLILSMLGISQASAEQAPERASFEEFEKWLIGTFLENEEEERGRGRGDSREKDRDKGRGKANESLGAKVEGLNRNSTLPSNMEVSDLPRELELRLPPLADGLERVLVGDQVALVEQTSGRIRDLFDVREARENGPPRELAVCHVPPGNPSKRKTLSLPEPAIRSHLDHGDYIGPCR